MIRQLFDRIREWVGESPHSVELYCPQTGEMIASENTEPMSSEAVAPGQMAALYACASCGGRHAWVWGPPAPARIDPEDVEWSD